MYSTSMLLKYGITLREYQAGHAGVNEIDCFISNLSLVSTNIEDTKYCKLYIIQTHWRNDFIY